MRTRITTLSVGLLFAAAYAGPLPSPKIRLRDRVTGSLRAFGFSIDPADSAQLRSRDGNRYIIIL